MNRSRRQPRAFTLIEVLCALVLIGIVLPVAMRGVSVSLKAAYHAKHTAEATELARSKLAELSLASDVGELTGTGDFTDREGYRWQSRAVEQNYGVTLLTVQVFWKALGGEDSITLDTFVYPNALTTGSATTSTDGTSPSGNAGGTN